MTDEDDRIRAMLNAYAEDPFNTDRLHADLLPYVETFPRIGVCLRSPFVVSVPFFSWKMANDKYAHQRAMFDAFVAKREFNKAVWCLERPFRMTFLLDWHEDGLITSVEDLREITADVWVDTENPSSHGSDRIVELFTDTGFIHDCDSDPRDWLPGVATVYRGQPYGAEVGTSWTTDKAIAEFFARRFESIRGRGIVYEAQLNMRLALAMFTGRKESEIVCNPDDLHAQHWAYVNPRKPESK